MWFPNDPRQTPASRFLDEVVEAGYDWVELGPFGYLPTDPVVLKRELALGTWQAIYLIEHRTRPHRREIVLEFAGTIS